MAAHSLRRLKAASVFAGLWALPWAALGVALALVSDIRDGTPIHYGHLLGSAIVHAASGGICGFLFSAALASVARASRGRVFPTTVSVATGVAAALAGVTLGVGPVSVAAFGLMGAFCAGGTMRLAGLATQPAVVADVEATAAV